MFPGPQEAQAPSGSNFQREAFAGSEDIVAGAAANRGAVLSKGGERVAGFPRTVKGVEIRGRDAGGCVGIPSTQVDLSVQETLLQCSENGSRAWPPTGIVGCNGMGTRANLDAACNIRRSAFHDHRIGRGAPAASHLRLPSCVE